MSKRSVLERSQVLCPVQQGEILGGVQHRDINSISCQNFMRKRAQEQGRRGLALSEAATSCPKG